MATVTFKGAPVQTIGTLPSVGTKAPDFNLVKGDLSEANLASFAGKKLILNIFPSIDTGVCATSVRKFNEAASKCENTEVVCVSVDLPFAQGRFCGAEGIENVTTVSAFRSPEFGKDYGVVITDGPLKGLLSRAVVVLDTEGKVKYTELVPEITQEPDYEAALGAL